MDFVAVSVRVPKSGSSSLSRILADAFAGARIFYLYNTLDPDSTISALQRWRYRRSLTRNLRRRYRTRDLAKVYAKISTEAANGDLIDGGHIDFATVRARVNRPLKMITLLRDPVERVRSEYNYARQAMGTKNIFNRFDAGVMPKIASRNDFSGFLDFLFEHREAYGNLASRYIGWNGKEDLAGYFARNVFHAGVLEDSERFAADLSKKIGKPLTFPQINRVKTPTATEITKSQRSRIEQIYPLDFTLYEWVQANKDSLSPSGGEG